MTGFIAGERWQHAYPHLSPAGTAVSSPFLIRATAVLPVLLLSGGGAVAAPVWLCVVAGNFVAGASKGSRLQERQQAVPQESWSPAIRREDIGLAVVRVTGWARPKKNGRWNVPARLLAWSPANGDSIGEPISGPGFPRPGDGISLTGSNEPPSPGSVLTSALRITVPTPASLPGGFDHRQYLSGRGLKWQARITDSRVAAPGDPVARFGAGLLGPVRRNILDRLEHLLPDREAQLSGAVLLGSRTEDSRAISAPFTVLGMAHLFAVSGLHVGILLGIVLLPGRVLGWSPRLTVWPLWILVPLYLILTGMPGSVVRAGGMGLIAAQARPLGRRCDTLRLLGLLYWAGSILDPTQNQDTGLRLSYLAAGGILLVSRITDGFKLGPSKWAKPIATGLAVSFAAQWFTMPIVARSFGLISLLSPLANMIIVPMFGLAVWTVVTALVASVIWLPLGQVLAAWAWFLLRSINGSVAWFSEQTGGAPWGLGIPQLGQDVGWFVLTVLLLILLRQRKNVQRRWPLDLLVWGLLPVLLLLLTGPAARTLPDGQSVVVWQFDVGQGDCALLVFPDGWTALIDTGGRFGHRAPPTAGPLGRNILPFLRRQGISHIDAVLLTHGHLDHTGGALALADAVEVKNWYVAGRADRALGGAVDSTTVWRPVAGNILHQWRQWQLAVHYPLPGQEHVEGENNWSIVVALSHDSATEMVWSGDLELAGEAALLAADSRLAPTRVLKAGHHGSNTSGSPALMARLQPQLVLISCGVGNSYGHPSHGPYLVANGAQVDTIPLLRTDTQGSIRLEWAADSSLRWQTRSSSGYLARSP